ncbi:ATP-binding cassette domain-containing protein [Streptomyces sp. cmx-4-9]|uniref:ATP-binding cassette domain-containing protein n=1 Tax=Streptomyces sp. cmx-4-9 TaxID=2790941 RepID=UPI0039811330
MSEYGTWRRLAPDGRRFLRGRARTLVRLALWSLLESAHTFLGGYAVARALDDGFLAGRTTTGLGWLAAAAAGALLGAVALRGVFAGLADLVEPLRDGLVRRAVRQALGRAVADPGKAGDLGAVSRLAQQTEMARDSFAGLVLVARSFVFTALGALAGLAALAPLMLLLVLPPLLLGAAGFAATLGPMARVQRQALDTDEALAARSGALATGLRDVVACGGGTAAGAPLETLIARQEALTGRLARWTALRTLALGVAGRLPVVALLAGTPWLLDRGVSAGALAGALTYLVQSLLPALDALMTAVGSAGTRLLVVLDRFVPDAPGPAGGARPAGPRGGPDAVPPTEPGGRPDAVTRTEPADGTVPPSPTGPARTARPAPATARAGRTRSAPSAAAEAATPAPEPLLPPPPGAGAETRPAVELRRVRFAYGAHAHPVIDGLDLRVEPGEHLAVVGPSGIGKSTLLALLAGLLTPDQGAVLLDGSPARRPHADHPDGRRTLLPQQPYVFTGTVRENLTHLSPGPVGAARAHAAAAALGAGALLDRLGGLDAPVDPARLSQGERQLLALTAAYLSPAPLLLLDEATCHLDPRAEEHAERALAARPGTLVVVAHRVSSAVRADRVLVLDGTRAVCGTHAELPARSDLYRDLVGLWSADA